MIVVCSKPGQLGNRLFIFASFVAFSKEHQVPVMNVSFDEYAEFFPCFKPDAYNRYPFKKSFFNGAFVRKISFLFFYYLARVAIRLKIKNRLVYARELDWNEQVNMDEQEFVKLAKTTRLLLLQGWIYRSPVSYAKHQDSIREVFTPEKHFLRNVDALFQKLRAGAELVIGIHIRHGDYAKFEGGKFFYSFGQYLAVMKSIEELFPGKHVRFLVCSNVSIDPAIFREVDFFTGTGHFVEDLYALSCCDYLAGPPSTFTMWASFYGKAPLCIIDKAGKIPLLSDFVVKTG